MPSTVRPLLAAELVRRGHSKHVLDGPRWRRTTRGFYVPAGTASTPTQRVVEAAAVAPVGAVLGGWAAAFALGSDLLDGLDDHTMRPIPVTVILPPRLHRASVPGIRYCQQALDADDVVSLRDLHFTRPVRTALDLARSASTGTEAVVVLDAMLQAKVISTPALERRLGDLAGRRGVRQAALAVSHCRPGVRSSWESRLRMLYVLDLGFDVPLVNPPVFDRAGRFLGVPDLLDVAAGLVLEYDGGSWNGTRTPGGHRDRDQHREDNAREELFERAGLLVVRADQGDMSRYRRRLRDRLTAARSDGLRRDRTRDGWTLQPPDHGYGMPA